METFDIIGWLAMGTTMLSFTVGNIVWLRIINITACVIWIIYGLMMNMDLPFWRNHIIVTNSLIAGIHLFWFAKLYMKKKTKPAELQ